jgi:hypothetical protein
VDVNRSAAALVPRIAAFVVVGVAATAGVTWAASRGVPPTAPTPTVTTEAPAPPLVVPDVRRQAFVFAKGSLEDAGFAWRVAGSVHGYAPNTVVTETPAPGTRVTNTGAPLVTLTLKRNAGYPQQGEAEDSSPYDATAVQPVASEGLGPALPATTTGGPPAAKPGTAPKRAAKTAKAATPAGARSTWPKSRPAAFTVPGGKPEPLDEMPLPDRAAALGRWLGTHRTRTNASVQYWAYQNAWVVAGAKLGWWHGAQALKTLVQVDRRTQALWGIGAKSAAVARQALAYVVARSQR